MFPVRIPRGRPVELTGSGHARGRMQAERCPDQVAAVRHAVDLRMAEMADRLAEPATRDYLDRLDRFHRAHDPEIMAELAGLGTGFGIPPRRLFDYLMLSLVADLDAGEACLEGCTAFAATAADGGGAVLAKNRDYRAEHRAIQRVFRHRDPAWGGRTMLCVGSLGSPGNFSSGINSDGLAVADTASRTPGHQVGRHRYFLLTRLLARCASVADALAGIAATAQAGGGLLLLADASGRMAAVELGAPSVAVEIRQRGRIGRSNHYVGESTAGLNRTDGGAGPGHANSVRRLATLRRLLAAGPESLGVADAAAILAHRGDGGEEPLCRRGGRDLSETVSGAIFATGERRLWFADGRPDRGDWTHFDLDDDQP